ncbi:MAG: hypothetical protein HC846_00980 [Blastocatellia bacterium]|nr:hypothetical protein [Blastocatellia bacterium]
MKKQLFLTIIAVVLFSANLFAQSKDESRPTPVSGNTIRTTLVDDNPDSYQTYYFSMNLNAGRYRAVLKTTTKQCEGSGVSVYIDDEPNVFNSVCDNETGIGIARAELDFTLQRSGTHIIKIYATGADGERLNVELSFNGGSKPKKEPVADIKTCTYSDNFSLSDARPRYERVFNGLVFRRGTAQMFITTVNDEGTNVSGTVYAEQTDRGQYNENMVLPVDGFGGTIGTPLNNEPIREVQQISGNGKGNIKILFEQNGNNTNKTGRYKLVVKGDAIVSCGNNVVSLTKGGKGKR